MEQNEVKVETTSERSAQGQRPRRPRRPRREFEVKEYQERTVAIKRVTKVVKGGKHMRFTALVVIGNSHPA